MNNQEILAIASEISNWIPMREVPKRCPQFNYTQIKNLFWKREQKAGLSRCARQVGNKLYICLPLFGAWMAGELPEQQKEGKSI